MTSMLSFTKRTLWTVSIHFVTRNIFFIVELHGGRVRCRVLDRGVQPEELSRRRETYFESKRIRKKRRMRRKRKMGKKRGKRKVRWNRGD